MPEEISAFRPAELIHRPYFYYLIFIFFKDYNYYMRKTLPALKPRQVLRALLRLGFYIHHQTGSHAQLRHPEKTHLRVTIPRHERFDLPKSLVRAILKQAEVSVEKFLESLRD